MKISVDNASMSVKPKGCTASAFLHSRHKYTIWEFYYTIDGYSVNTGQCQGKI